jgi:hypothetical protein
MSIIPFDDRDGQIWFDGVLPQTSRLVPISKPRR